MRGGDSSITQLKAQGPSRTCNESKEEEGVTRSAGVSVVRAHGLDAPGPALHIQKDVLPYALY